MRMCALLCWLQVEEYIDPELVGPEQCLHYPLWVDLDLKRDMGDDFSFDVDDCELQTSLNFFSVFLN